MFQKLKIILQTDPSRGMLETVNPQPYSSREDFFPCKKFVQKRKNKHGNRKKYSCINGIHSNRY